MRHPLPNKLHFKVNVPADGTRAAIVGTETSVRRRFWQLSGTACLCGKYGMSDLEAQWARQMKIGEANASSRSNSSCLGVNE